MKKIIITTFSLLLTVGAAMAQNWTIDKAHSRLGFAVNYLSIVTVDGSFRSVDATITASKPDFSDATVQLTVDANSINTDSDQRDQVLKSADFFDAAQFNQLVFKSTGIKRIKGNVYALSGNLTLHGVTKPVALEMTFNGTATNPYSKKTIAGFKVTGSIKRSDFNLGAGFPAPALADAAELDANIMLTAN